MSKRRVTIAAAGAVFALLSIGGALFMNSATPQKKAWTACKGFVTDRLKAPSSAQFMPFADRAVDHDPQTMVYTVQAWVEAQNRLGVALRTYYTCRVVKAGDRMLYKELELEK